jgi:bifunctional UDP-N-acetylglucosamine pyrophosphorylase/glucosamine-1-phosphate N-acetyltransferase
MSFVAVVLAAGQGTRMKSARPKVLHSVAGWPMVAWPVEAALAAGASRVVVVVGHGREEVEKDIRARWDDRVRTAVQADQRGTGHAVQCAMDAIGEASDVVILYGDVPLLEAEAIEKLRAARGDRPLALLTCRAPDPTGYGRILRENGAVVGIREHKDASAAERTIDEINPGVYAVETSFLRDALKALRSDNAQGELYLTDVVSRAAPNVASVEWPIASLAGVNDRAQLAEASKAMYRRIAARHAVNGATVRDLDQAFIDATVAIEPDAIIEHGVTLRGKTRIGQGARIDVGSVLTDVEVDANANVKPYTIAQSSRIGAGAQVGPFSHLRPGSELGPDVHVGNFVETKKTTMAKGSKANHLAYLGDGIIEEDVNVGAGTIFCNYDGFQKHTTVLEKGSFIGSDSQLVAPVRVGKGAYVATGTTVTKNVPDDALAVGRVRQSNKEGYASRLRARMRAAAEDAKKDAAKK